MSQPFWPNETPLAVIRPDHRVYWHVQGLLLCGLFAVSVGASAVFGPGDGADRRGSGAVMIGLLTLVAPMVFNAWNELRLTWTLTDRRIILPGGDYVLLTDITGISVRWQGITLKAKGRKARVVRLSFLANPAAAAARIALARAQGV